MHKLLKCSQIEFSTPWNWIIAAATVAMLFKPALDLDSKVYSQVDI